MTASRIALAALASVALGGSPAGAADPPDLSKAARPPRKEPAFVAKQPLYGLAVFGPRADAAVWMVSEGG